MDTCLYERLVGAAWKQVHPAVRQAHLHTNCPHTDCLQSKGTFRIRHGRGHLTRVLAWLLRLPRPAEAMTVQLHVVPSECGEVWVRIFGKKRRMRRLITTQREAAGGLLAERFGLLEFRFKLTVRGGALCYAQRKALLHLGCRHLPVPSWLAPQVAATESAASAASIDRTHVLVTVSLPLAGLLIRYEGDLQVAEMQK